VFPGQKLGKPLSTMVMLSVLKDMNYDESGEPRWVDPKSGRPITPHGLRATFRTRANPVRIALLHLALECSQAPASKSDEDVEFAFCWARLVRRQCRVVTIAVEQSLPLPCAADQTKSA
jgi:hypothetical protein